MTRPVSRFVCGGWLLAISTCVLAEQLPLWEVALGGGVLRIPEYRGSGTSDTLLFPFVLPLYRGERIRIDDRGIRGIFYDTERVELDFSVDANPKVDSEDDSARAGMPDLDATVQLGPLLELRLWTDRPSRRVLFLNLPVRAVFSVSTSNVEHVGFTGSPHLTFYQGLVFLGRAWRLGLSAGLQFGDEDLHEFYYQVEPEFARPGRDEFDAQGGFGGTRFIATLVSRTDKTWISLFARYDRLDSAVFEDSPLVERRDGLTVGFIYSWFVARSKRSVSVDW
ncbi:MAG: MipA/OmpV family protein [Gammaproteobacteria bacterium]|nr:MipA/OmpV family protein [Gammaproteobacteria bacterium]